MLVNIVFHKLSAKCNTTMALIKLNLVPTALILVFVLSFCNFHRLNASPADQAEGTPDGNDLKVTLYLPMVRATNSSEDALSDDNSENISAAALDTVVNKISADRLATYLPVTHGVPEAILGHKILAVLTPDNTPCIGEAKRLVLQTDIPDLEKFLQSDEHNIVSPDNILQELSNLRLQQGNWEFMIVGPGTTQDSLISGNEKWAQVDKTLGCQYLKPLAATPNPSEIKTGAGTNGYAIFENTDAGTYSNLKGQAINFSPPLVVGFNQNAFSAMVNNVASSLSPFYLLQNGIVFQNGTGKIVWTNTTKGYAAQNYSTIPYNSTHTYYFVISYASGTTWSMCARDNIVPSTYTCIPQSGVPGTTLKSDLDTSVFAENANTVSNWYLGTSITWYAWGARNYPNGIGQNWLSQHKHTEDGCSTTWPPGSALGGSLVNGGTGTFNVSGIPLHC